jgi:hypothetical protein
MQVRFYTTRKPYHQQGHAETKFIGDNVMVRRQIILLPKVLHYHAKDSTLELLNLEEDDR